LSCNWLPWPGRHTLALVDGGNAVLDQVRFEVRGAVEKPPRQSSGKL
jgi:penicillin-binding protein 1C